MIRCIECIVGRHRARDDFPASCGNWRFEIELCRLFVINDPMRADRPFVEQITALVADDEC